MNKLKGVVFLTLVIILIALSCYSPESHQTLLTPEYPLHLEEHLEASMIEGSEIPEDIPASVVWNFNEPQPDWKSVTPLDPSSKPDLVKKYTELLKMEWKAHQEVARLFTRAADAPLIPEQLKTLRSLGYIK